MPEARDFAPPGALLDLDADALRLREAARAWAADAIDQQDYRAIRAATLETLVARHGGIADGGAADDAARVTAKAAARDAGVEPARAASRRQRSRWWWAVGAALAVLVVLLLSSADVW